MEHRYFIAFLFLLLASLPVKAQEYKYYDSSLRPDIWYNGIDGVRLGIVFEGREVLDINDDQLINAGIWFHTINENQTLSYYASYAKIIDAASILDSFADINLTSFSRAGLTRHQVAISKRYVDLFKDDNVFSFSVGLRTEEFFEEDYLYEPVMWETLRNDIVSLNMQLSRVYDVSRLRIELNLAHNIYDNSGSRPFSTGNIELNHSYRLGYFELRNRIYVGVGTSGLPVQYSFPLANAPTENWINSPFFRANGTIPSQWLDKGNIQYSGGAGLRGYNEHDYFLIRNNNSFSYQRVGALNTELSFINPIDNWLNSIQYIGDLVKFDSYLFTDVGSLSNSVRNREVLSTSSTEVILDDVVANAGLGFLLDVNIPDWLGNRRGFIIRYEVPFWLSYPLTGEDNFKFRQVVGFGGVINF